PYSGGSERSPKAGAVKKLESTGLSGWCGEMAAVVSGSFIGTTGSTGWAPSCRSGFVSSIAFSPLVRRSLERQGHVLTDRIVRDSISIPRSCGPVLSPSSTGTVNLLRVFERGQPLPSVWRIEDLLNRRWLRGTIVPARGQPDGRSRLQ